MLVFIDDSGDPGFKFNKGSTSHFVIAMVIFDDDLEVEKTAVAIKELKRDIGLSDADEFRFFKTCNDYKKLFFKKIKPFSFKIRALVVNKSVIYSTKLKTDKNSFYAYFIKEVIKKSHNTLLNARIRIDGSGDRIFRRNFFTYLRRELNSTDRKLMKNCKMLDSKGNVMIQMADMVAGCVNRTQSTKPDAKDYIKIIKGHVEDIWRFK